MKTLFCNTSREVCGVHQFGLNLWSILYESDRVDWDYQDNEFLPPPNGYDAIVYNWQGLIGGWMAQAPFPIKAKQVLCYHDLDIDAPKWDAILFADPTMAQHDNWYPMGRPVPPYTPIINPLKLTQPIIGVHGFLGAWADNVVSRVVQEFEHATVRLLVPFSEFCDPQGDQAKSMVERCRQISTGSGVDIRVQHEFLPSRGTMDWLAQNDLNCYMRPPHHWRGVSSAPDMALAARKPIAVNKCNAFRHLHATVPSICIEDSSIGEIIRNGLSPLVPLYQAWSPEEIRKDVESVLFKVVGKE